jgi:hypothetical protein
MTTSDEESVKSFDAEDQDRRRKKAYKLYKHYAKPTRENMCRILDYATDTDITRQDVDLLPWNPDKTEVIKEAMKSPKKKQKMEKKDMLDSQSASPQKSPPRGRGVVRIVSSKMIRGTSAHSQGSRAAAQPTALTPNSEANGAASFVVKGGKLVKKDVTSPGAKKKEAVTPGAKKKGTTFSVVAGKLVKSDAPKVKEAKKKDKTETSTDDKKKKKKDKKEKERDGREDAAFAKSNGCEKDTTLIKGQIGDSSTSLDISRNGSSGSADTTSSSWDQDHTQDHRVSAEQLRTIKVEEEHKRKKEERRRKREEATKKSMPAVDEQEKSTADTRSNIKEARCDDRLERAYQWYTRMATPSRKEFKRRVADVVSIDITPEDIDLLPWNLTGRVVNIAKMNAIIRASILKQ